eukprot:3585717-Pyramimonas_sp.AAC.1
MDNQLKLAARNMRRIVAAAQGDDVSALDMERLEEFLDGLESNDQHFVCANHLPGRGLSTSPQRKHSSNMTQQPDCLVLAGGLREGLLPGQRSACDGQFGRGGGNDGDCVEGS